MVAELKNEELYVAIISKGAQMQSIRDHEGNEYLWQGDPRYWKDRALNLFPYIARLTEGKYIYRDREYSMNIHGFVPESELRIEESKPERAVFSLHSGPETREQYPFEFLYSIVYELRGNKLSVTYHVENESNDTMYFGAGGHPGFRVPFEPGRKYEDYYLQFEKGIKPVRIGFSESCFRNGQDEDFNLPDDGRLPISHSMFDNDAIVLKNAGHSVCLQAAEGSRMIRVDFPDMDYLGIWSAPKTCAPYVCIEPWSSLPSRDGIVEDIEEQKDLIALPKGKSWKAEWSIQIGK